jgi:hypothetical protein
MGIWSRSWELWRMSFGIIRKDKEMLLFPVLSALFSIAFAFAMFFPTVIVHIFDDGSPRFGLVEVFLTLIVYTGFAFAATFCNTCVTYTTKVRIEGGNATFGQSVRFALSRAHLLFAWSVVAATVGVILAAIENLAERVPGVGKLLLVILRLVLGAAWSIMTIFVVPVLVFEQVGPFEAIKRSAGLVKQTWGENLRRFYTMGLVQFVLAVPALLVLFLTAQMAQQHGGPSAGGVVLGVWVLVFVYLFALSYVFAVANTVYKAALYIYARESRVPEGFSEGTMQAAFRARG